MWKRGLWKSARQKYDFCYFVKLEFSKYLGGLYLTTFGLSLKKSPATPGMLIRNFYFLELW